MIKFIFDTCVYVGVLIEHYMHADGKWPERGSRWIEHPLALELKVHTLHVCRDIHLCIYVYINICTY
jgi:hypothetical protein